MLVRIAGGSCSLCYTQEDLTAAVRAYVAPFPLSSDPIFEKAPSNVSDELYPSWNEVGVMKCTIRGRGWAKVTQHR